MNEEEQRLTWLVRSHSGITITFRVRWCDPHLQLCQLRWACSPAAQLLPFTAAKHVLIIPVGLRGTCLSCCPWTQHGALFPVNRKGKEKQTTGIKGNKTELLTSCMHPAGGCSSARRMTLWRPLFWSWSWLTWMKPRRFALSAAEATESRILKPE